MLKDLTRLAGSYIYHIGIMKMYSLIIHLVPDKYFDRAISNVVYHAKMFGHEMMYFSKMYGRCGNMYLDWSEEKLRKIAKKGKDQGL